MIIDHNFYLKFKFVVKSIKMIYNKYKYKYQKNNNKYKHRKY